MFCLFRLYLQSVKFASVLTCRIEIAGRPESRGSLLRSLLRSDKLNPDCQSAIDGISPFVYRMFILT